MEREFLQLPIWDQFTAREAEAAGRALARCLPPPWAFDAVEFHQMGDQKRQVAFFSREGARFALLPGGEVTLGYDRGRPLELDEDALEEWRRRRAPEDRDWGTFLDSCLTPLRRVTIAPLLLEVNVAPYGMVRVPRGTPIDDKGGSVFLGYHELQEGVARVSVYFRRITFEALRAELAEAGFRPPTSDEWEYGCSGGSRAVWPWGDRLAPAPAPGERPLWDRPTAFGLRIAFDSFVDELCGPPPVWRGGDGGLAVRHCEGILAWQVAFASAYHTPIPAEEALFRCPNVRRAFPLPPDCFD